MKGIGEDSGQKVQSNKFKVEGLKSFRLRLRKTQESGTLLRNKRGQSCVNENQIEATERRCA